MINLSLDNLAANKQLEEQLVRYIADATDEFSSEPAHRYIVKSWLLEEQNLGANETAGITAYGYKPCVTQHPFPATDTEKFFFGNSFLSFFMWGLTGTWSVQVTMDVPGINADPLLLYLTNVSVPAYVDGAVIVNVPMMPVYGLKVLLTTGAASSLNFAATVGYNGLYFSK